MKFKILRIELGSDPELVNVFARALELDEIELSDAEIERLGIGAHLILPRRMIDEKAVGTVFSLQPSVADEDLRSAHPVPIRDSAPTAEPANTAAPATPDPRALSQGNPNNE